MVLGCRNIPIVELLKPSLSAADNGPLYKCPSKYWLEGTSSFWHGRNSTVASTFSQGEALAAFALTEPNAGSDASGVETRAVYDPKKNVYIVNGKKQWITNGGIAQVLTVMAQTTVDSPKGKQDKNHSISSNARHARLTVTAQALEKVGMRGSKTANLEFHNMEVPAENILGPLGGGLKVCLTCLIMAGRHSELLAQEQEKCFSKKLLNIADHVTSLNAPSEVLDL